jgi:putative phage-type endonuclease
MSAMLKLVQGSEEWHSHRLSHRNASETPAVMGLSPWVSPFQLWEQKTGRRVQEINFAMKRGSELEPKAREAYEAKTGLVMEPCVMVDGLYSASLDGISFEGDLILEVKVPVSGKQSETWQAVEAGTVPEHYYWQVQTQLMVTKAGKAHFYVYEDEGGDGIWVEVLPCPEDIQRLREAWDAFWMHIENDTPPPLTELDTVIRTDQEWEQAAREFASAKQAADEATKAINDARTKLSSLAQHNSEKGFGVAVSKFWKANSTKQEVRVSLCKGETTC